MPVVGPKIGDLVSSVDPNTGQQVTRLSPFISPMPGRASEYVVNRAGQWEAVRWDFYDSAAYPAAGLTQQIFFQTPQGSGGKTFSDTNMTLNGQIPQGQMFLTQAVGINFFPTTPTVAADMPAAFGTGATQNILNDQYIFWRSGNLKMTVGSKPYLQIAPLLKAPARTQFALNAALSDTTTAAASRQGRSGIAEIIGPYFDLGTDPILMDAGQNFDVTLAWPEGLQVITNPSRMILVLSGTLFRLSQ